MSAERDLDRAVRALLKDGQTELPIRAFDAVRHDIHRTRQRAVIGPWRVPDMSAISRVALPAAAVLVLVVAWASFGPSLGGAGGGPSPAPTPLVSPTMLPAVTEGELAPGRYRFGGTPLSAEVPAGWTGVGETAIVKNDGDEAGAGFAVGEISGTFVDPCTDHTLVKPAPTSIDELAAALASQAGTTATPPADVTIDGHRGKVVAVTVTADLATCSPDGFWLWASPNEGRRHVQGTQEIDRIYIIDVEDFRFTFFAWLPARTTAADRQEVDAIIESIDIQIR